MKPSEQDRLDSFDERKKACGYGISMMQCACCAHVRHADGWCVRNDFHVNLDRGFCKGFSYYKPTPPWEKRKTKSITRRTK